MPNVDAVFKDVLMTLVHARTVVGNMRFTKVSTEIKITCWTGKTLFKGPHTDPQVNEVLDANRCQCGGIDECKACDGTGYSGDFEVNWTNENNTRNVYEFINY